MMCGLCSVDNLSYEDFIEIIDRSMWIMCFINKGSTGQSMLYSAEHDVVNNQYRRKNNLHTYTALLNTYYAPTPPLA